MIAKKVCLFVDDVFSFTETEAGLLIYIQDEQKRRERTMTLDKFDSVERRILKRLTSKQSETITNQIVAFVSIKQSVVALTEAGTKAANAYETYLQKHPIPA